MVNIRKKSVFLCVPSAEPSLAEKLCLLGGQGPGIHTFSSSVNCIIIHLGMIEVVCWLIHICSSWDGWKGGLPLGIFSYSSEVVHGKFSLISHHKGGCKCGCQQLACDSSYKQRQTLHSHLAGWGEGGRLFVHFPHPSVHLAFQVPHLPKHVAFLRTLMLKETFNTVIVRTWREINIISIFHFWE